jgi:hypothetical protein
LQSSRNFPSQRQVLAYITMPFRVGMDFKVAVWGNSQVGMGDGNGFKHNISKSWKYRLKIWQVLHCSSILYYAKFQAILTSVGCETIDATEMYTEPGARSVVRRILSVRSPHRRNCAINSVLDACNCNATSLTAIMRALRPVHHLCCFVQ